MASYSREEVTYSKQATNTEVIKGLIYSDNSRPFYEAVLALVPGEYKSVKIFGKQALKSLQVIPSEVPSDCLADVVHILDGLLQAGLVKAKYTNYFEGFHDRHAGGHTEYCLA